MYLSTEVLLVSSSRVLLCMSATQMYTNCHLLTAINMSQMYTVYMYMFCTLTCGEHGLESV